MIMTDYVRTGDALILTERWPADLEGPPMHLHRRTTEVFEVLSGAICLIHPEGERRLAAGERAEIAPGRLHTFRGGPMGAAVRITLSPAGEMEAFFRTVAAARREGRNMLMTLARLNAAGADFYLARPPVALQRALYLALGPLAAAAGHPLIRDDRGRR